MTVSLSLFLPLVKALAPSVPNPVAEQFLRLAARQFLSRTRLWREVITIAVTANPFRIAPPYASVIGIESSVFEGRPLDPVRFSDIDLDRINDTGAPDCLLETAPDQFRLYPFEAGDLTVSAFLTLEAGPRFGITGPTTEQANQGLVPDFLFADHADEIANGAASLAMRSPNQPYSDPNAAALFDAIFQRAIDSYSTRSIRGKQRAPARTRASYL